MSDMRNIALLILCLFWASKPDDAFVTDCGPYCCNLEIAIPIPCSDNFGGIPSEYEYQTDVGSIVINPDTGLPEVVIPAGTLPCGEVTAVETKCKCLDTDCELTDTLNIETFPIFDIEITSNSGVCIDNEDLVIQTNCINMILGSFPQGTADQSAGTITFEEGEIPVGTSIVTVNCRGDCLATEDIEVLVCEKPFFNPSCFSPTTPPQ